MQNIWLSSKLYTAIQRKKKITISLLSLSTKLLLGLCCKLVAGPRYIYRLFIIKLERILCCWHRIVTIEFAVFFCWKWKEKKIWYSLWYITVKWDSIITFIFEDKIWYMKIVYVPLKIFFCFVFFICHRSEKKVANYVQNIR